jgi:hypothetical protein
MDIMGPSVCSFAHYLVLKLLFSNPPHIPHLLRDYKEFLPFLNGPNYTQELYVEIHGFRNIISYIVL